MRRQIVRYPKLRRQKYSVHYRSRSMGGLILTDSIRRLVVVSVLRLNDTPACEADHLPQQMH